jgi:hypothetical protein
MRLSRVSPAVFAGLALAGSAAAQGWDRGGVPGSMVGVSVEVDGGYSPLYRAPDGSDRWYLEARPGSRYAITLANRTRERLGVVVTVDGLNAISGQPDIGTGRMYVLGPWDQTTVRGWRTSLSEVRRFTFVDERDSYATRSGKANSKMGWIQVAVYRERRPEVQWPWLKDGTDSGWGGNRAPREGDENPRAEASPPSLPLTEPPPPMAKASPQQERPSDQAAGPRSRADGYAPERPRSFPGTGWGPRADDPVVLVNFDPEPSPSERVTLRYEYASTLRALGVLPRPSYQADRLRERERGEGGFAQPPLW